jgi:hypothetical protein
LAVPPEQLLQCQRPQQLLPQQQMLRNGVMLWLRGRNPLLCQLAMKKRQKE